MEFSSFIKKSLTIFLGLLSLLFCSIALLFLLVNAESALKGYTMEIEDKVLSILFVLFSSLFGIIYAVAFLKIKKFDKISTKSYNFILLVLISLGTSILVLAYSLGLQPFDLGFHFNIFTIIFITLGSVHYFFFVTLCIPKIRKEFLR